MIFYTLSGVEIKLVSQIQLPRSVPRVVKSNEFGFFSKLRARIRVYEKKGNLFLGYCKRCPICDEAWLVKHQLT
jgi:hypothetical protein